MVEGRVSIIIPMYNASIFLQDTIDSCLAQKYKDKEIILIDDCSSDNTYNIAVGYENKTSGIKVLKNDKNQGLIKTINAALDYITGEFVLVLGNDDILSDQHLTTMVNALVSFPKSSFAYCRSILIDESGKEIGMSDTIDVNDDLSQIAYSNPINSCGLLMKTEKLFSVGKYPVIMDCPNYGEWLLWINMMSIGKAVFVDQVKSYYRIHANNLTKSFLDKDKVQKNYMYNLTCMDCALKTFDFDLVERLKITIRKLIYKIKMVYFIKFRR